MRWDALFADLEAQAAALGEAERAAEVSDRTRGELARLHVVDRARASVGSSIRTWLHGGHAVHGQLARVGPDWLLLVDDTGTDTVIALHSVVLARGFGRYSASPETAGLVESRLGLRHVLRGLARDRAAVRLMLTDGSSLDGTIDRVGGDFIEAAIHPTAEPRRHAQVHDLGLIPLPGLVGARRLR